jgi:diguanylate cyclase (GGDEF)-like protein/PAS domain S-box-containing protein
VKSHDKPLILIVDDDQLMRVTFQEVLKEAGFQTATASDGTTALSNFMFARPDMVLLDLSMPGKDGFITCQEIRSIPEGKYVPIIIITGRDETGLIHRAFEAGATDFIVKPVKPELLVYRVRYTLRASRSMIKLAESEERLASAQRIAHLGNWDLNTSTGMFRCSSEIFSIIGLAQDSQRVSFERFLFTVHPSDRHMVASCLATAARQHNACSIEFCIKRSDDTLRTVLLQGRVDPQIPGKTPHMSGTLQDVTEMRQVEDRARMLKEAVDCLPIGITLCDVNGKIIYANPAEAEMHGYADNELVGKEARQLAPQGLVKELKPDQLNTIGLFKRESTNLRKNGEEFPVQLTSIAVRNSEGRCLGLVTTCEDITGRKEAEIKMHRLAYYDPLTNLPNRSMFLDRLHQALALAFREKRKVCLVFIDLDNFKDVNDTHGHDLGDKLLQEVAVRLAGTMRESDTLARLGGDEFVVVLTSVTSHESTAMAAQRILSVFTLPFFIDGKQIYSSASIGVALYPDDGRDTENLLKCADTAMYCAKNEGKAQFRFFSSEMNHKIMRRVALENCLRQGLEKEEFFVQYQPKWDIKTARMVGVEVLVRWQSPEFGLIQPSEFISLMENSGMILDLGQWVLRTACVQAKDWASAGHQCFNVAVNISGKQLKHPDFFAMIDKVVRESGVDPKILELEFTESVIMEQSDKTIDTLKLLKKMGVQLSIDDFGTGYSSLNYLKDFPIDRVNIDRSFISDISCSSDYAAIVEAIISMSHSLNMKVLAEGVETGAQLHFLTKLGCDEVQGFYLAVPMTACDLTKNLRGMHGRNVAWLPLSS